MILKEKSLKIQWVQKAIEKTDIGIMATSLLSSKIGNLIWKCQLKKKDYKILIPENQNFWHCVLKDWLGFSYQPPSNKNEVFRWFKFTLKPPIVVARDNL